MVTFRELLNRIPHRHIPGKFEGEAEVAEVIYYSFTPSEEFGDVEIDEYVAIFRGPFTDADIRYLDKEAPAHIERRLNDNEKEFLSLLTGVIAIENSQGFVSFTWYGPGGAPDFERDIEALRMEVEELEGEESID